MVDKTGKTAPTPTGADAGDGLGPADLVAAELALDDLFASARTAAPAALPEVLEQAILSEAAATQAAILERQALASDLASRSGEAGGGLFAGLREVLVGLGGWPALGGLVTASAAGLWIGLAPPAFLPDPVSLAGLEQVDDSLPYDSYDLAVVLSEEME
ncbi:hypothetical protein MACH17_27590 [Phaeobacter inhibens]|uniref:hypothetical protein n=1 Tax=Phaeobacter inhibens TaxID=221822 RepID=UPI00276C112C|nr:hypothetical protein [Phaeobacter inhibens]GLO71242.1 hypothetical protein MACH17_27590 [Phaeobacter inhibens]